MNTTNTATPDPRSPGLVELATRHGLKSYVEDGRIKIEAKSMGEIARVLASIGCDVVTEGKHSKKVILGSEYVGCIAYMRGFAYFFSTK